MNDRLLEVQKSICQKYGAKFCPVLNDQKVGIAENVRSGLMPINGLRHPPEIGTTGWYIWAGDELLQDEQFFKPLHVRHVSLWCADIEKYLGLSPGWRFLISGTYADVWYDESLLQI